MAEPTEEPSGTGETPKEPEVVEEREEPGAPDAEETLAGRTATLERDREAPTVRRPPVIEEAPRPDGAPDDAGEGPTGSGAVRRFLRGRAALLARLVREHRAAAAALGLLAVASVVLLSLALVRAGTLPGTDTIVADARSSFSAPERPAGDFDASGALVTQDVDVRSVSRSQSAPEGTTSPFGASGYATAEVVITYVGQGVRAQRGATLSYALVNGSWSLVGSSDEGLSWQATGGVDDDKIAAGAESLLGRAERELGLDGLLDLYAGADVTVASQAFDEEAQTDLVELEWEREGTFESHVCHMSVTFSFAQASGTWEISGIEVADGALEPVLDSVLGTWSGTFQSQETEGSKCLAARDAGLTVTIESVETSSGVTRATGTVSGLAHYHAHPAQDAASCDGDTMLEEVPFSATRAEGEGVVLEATLPEDVGGTVFLTLSFGDSEDPGRVTARVETTYPTTGTILFIPYEETLTYSDTFLLARAE